MSELSGGRGGREGDFEGEKSIRAFSSSWSSCLTLTTIANVKRTAREYILGIFEGAKRI